MDTKEFSELVIDYANSRSLILAKSKAFTELIHKQSSIVPIMLKNMFSGRRFENNEILQHNSITIWHSRVGLLYSLTSKPRVKRELDMEKIRFIFLHRYDDFRKWCSENIPEVCYDLDMLHESILKDNKDYYLSDRYCWGNKWNIDRDVIPSKDTKLLRVDVSDFKYKEISVNFSRYRFSVDFRRGDNNLLFCGNSGNMELPDASNLVLNPEEIIPINIFLDNVSDQLDNELKLYNVWIENIRLVMHKYTCALNI